MKKITMLDQAAGKYRLSTDLLHLATEGAIVHAIGRAPGGYVILWRDKQGWTTTMRKRGASSISGVLPREQAEPLFLGILLKLMDGN